MNQDKDRLLRLAAEEDGCPITAGAPPAEPNRHSKFLDLICERVVARAARDAEITKTRRARAQRIKQNLLTALLVVAILAATAASFWDALR